jgi:integrase
MVKPFRPIELANRVVRLISARGKSRSQLVVPSLPTVSTLSPLICPADNQMPHSCSREVMKPAIEEDWALQILEDYRIEQRPDRLGARVVELMRKADLHGVSLHSLRHSHASSLMGKGVPIAGRIGQINAVYLQSRVAGGYSRRGEGVERRHGGSDSRYQATCGDRPVSTCFEERTGQDEIH